EEPSRAYTQGTEWPRYGGCVVAKGRMHVADGERQDSRSRSKRAMTPFSAKTTMLGKPKRRRFNPLRSPLPPLKRTKNKSLPCLASPVHSEQVPLRAAVFVHPEEPLSVKTSLCAKYSIMKEFEGTKNDLTIFLAGQRLGSGLGFNFMLQDVESIPDVCEENTICNL
ncbi:putative E3 ubiquitin-protein ligase TOM1, partial [Dissostichus eleginoides]